MVERQDIDALLIGALYGELTPAEEKQLTAHLESHPGDRSALDGLTRARAALHESRILAVHLDPPQSISALLMQEAARRAPKVAPAEGEGWFARFVRSFVAHPALAAAAMLVLVVGFAAIIGRTQGKMSADYTLASESATTSKESFAGSGSAAPSPAMGDEQFAMQPSVAAAPAPEGRAGLDRDSAPGGVIGNADQGAGDGRLKNTESYNVDLAQNNEQLEASKRERKEPSTGAASKEYADGFVVNGKSPQPMNLDQPAKRKGAAGPHMDPPVDVLSEREVKARQELAFGGGGSAPGSSVDGRAGGAAPPPPPAPPMTTAPIRTTTAKPEPKLAKKQDTADDSAAVAKDVVDKKSTETKADPDAAWARQQHQALLASVKTGDCPRAASIAVAIEQRAPGYYATNVATDRGTKNCRAYIAQRREQAEAHERAKSARTLEESSPSPKKKAAPSKPKASDKAATDSTK